MSFRSRGGGARGRSGGNHQRFVPKSSTTSVTTSGASNYPLARLSAPLRKPSPPSRAFVKYLPQDEAVASGFGADNGGLDTIESQAVVDILNDELSSLLRLKPRDFWREVASNDSLHKALDSYLLFRNRWYDLPHRRVDGTTVAGIIVGDADLSRRVFMTFFRMSSNRDPGAPAHDCLSAKEHGALMQDKKLLDLPKLLDICSIYGHDNKELTTTLVNNVLKAQPVLVGLLPNACHQFLAIASTMHTRCRSSLKALASAIDQGTKDCSRLYTEFVEVVDFINDSVVTLDAFIDAYRQAAIFFSFPNDSPSNENGDLINTLASLHDSLLPSLHDAFVLLSARNKQNGAFLNGKVIENMGHSIKILSSRISKLGFSVLEICYLSDDFQDSTAPGTCGKIFPSQVSDPVIRGDILLQSFKDISHFSDGLPEKKSAWGTFLQIIERNYYILSRIDSLRSNGWIFLDDEQFHFLVRIITSFQDAADKVPNVRVSSHKSQSEENVDDVIMQSNISQLKEIFPDYGIGFLATCLDVYDQNYEEVTQRILEGTLHEDLLSMDTSLDQIVSSKKSSNVDVKGKGILVETAHQSKDKGKGLLYVKPPQAAGWSSSSGIMGEREEDEPLSSTSGRFRRKSNQEQPDSEVLDSKTAKDSLKSTVLAASEYEDEYDDSFDDLGFSVVETATEEADILGISSSSEVKNNDSRWNSSRKTPQFYVKDGKNYSYKISGSVAVSDAREASALVQSQRDLIHGLGRGGNIPYGVSRQPMVLHEDLEVATSGGRGMENSDSRDQDGRRNGSNRGRGRGRGRGGNAPIGSEKSDSHGQVNVGGDTSRHGDQNHYPRGRGSGRGANHHRKDRAMKKHFAGLTGY